jgi:hypothetical protein
MLPEFKYHPDPLATGAIKESDEVCDCCNQKRGYVYTSTLYSAEEIDSICPWCIADGSAANKYDGMFSDDYPLIEAGIPDGIIDEVIHRTPGFNSWQQEVWLTCCNDACAFHGDVSKKELTGMNLDSFREAFQDNRIEESFFEEFKKNYEPGGSPAIYKWVCINCKNIKYYADYS